MRKLVMVALGLCFLLSACAETKDPLKEKNVDNQSIGKSEDSQKPLENEMKLGSKIIWNGNIDEDFMDNEVIIIVDQSFHDEVLTIDDFIMLDVERVEEPKLNPVEPMLPAVLPVMYKITLKAQSKQGVIDAIRKLEKLDFVVSAEPNYYNTEPGNETKDWTTLVRESFLKQKVQPVNPTATLDDVSILHYYGTYDKSVVVMMDSVHFAYTEALRTEVVDQVSFYFNNGNGILVFNEGQFYSLKQAFDKGFLNHNDLVRINYHQKSFYPFLYTNEFSYVADFIHRWGYDSMVMGFKHIVTYDEYVEFIRLTRVESKYDEAYFENNGLIYYGWAEGSGSITVALDSVELDRTNNLNIVIERDAPMMGTCDMAYYQIAIEYLKPQEPLNSVNVYYKTLGQVSKTFEINNKTNVLDIQNLLDSKKDSITDMSLYVTFDTSKKDSKETFEAFNERMAEHYGLGRISDSMHFGFSFSYVSICIPSPNEIDLDLLYEIASTDEFINMTFSVYYYETYYKKMI